MNNRKVWFAVCYAVAAFFHFYYNPAHGRADDWGPMLFVPLVLGWVAFLLPAILPMVLIEEGAFHYAAWDDGHTMTTMLCATLLACLIWFFPPRVARWFGTYDAVSEKATRRLPSPVRGLASVLDALNRLKVGKCKSGGWA